MKKVFWFLFLALVFAGVANAAEKGCSTGFACSLDELNASSQKIIKDKTKVPEVSADAPETSKNSEIAPLPAPGKTLRSVVAPENSENAAQNQFVDKNGLRSNPFKTIPSSQKAK